MDDIESLAHARWECKYHVVWIPKYWRKAFYGELRKHLGPVLHELARQGECVVEEGHLNLDHVHPNDPLASIQTSPVRAILFDFASRRGHSAAS